MLHLYWSDSYSSGALRSASGCTHIALHHCSRAETVDMGVCCPGPGSADQTLSRSTLPHFVHCRAANGRELVHSPTITYTQSSTSTSLDIATRDIPLALEEQPNLLGVPVSLTG